MWLLVNQSMAARPIFVKVRTADPTNIIWNRVNGIDSVPPCVGEILAVLVRSCVKVIPMASLSPLLARLWAEAAVPGVHMLKASK